MKYLLIFSSLIMTVPISAATQWRDYICIAEQLRQNGSILPVSSSLEFSVKSNDGLHEITDLIGHVIAKNNPEGSPKLDFNAYHGIFYFKQLPNNPQYTGRVYKNHIQFRDFDAFQTNNNDGGGMWGEFVIAKAIDNKTPVDAHYIFKAGDHMGGTIDYICGWY